VSAKVGGNGQSLGQTSICDAMRELRCRPRQLWLDLARCDQSDRWRQETGIQAEEYFAELPELLADTEEALVLSCGETQLRRESREWLSVAEYQQRFPALAHEIALQFDVDRILEQDRP
jgi:hypothetical protein